MKIFAFIFLIHAYIANANPTSRIVGGNDAFPGEFPYQAAIQFGIPPIVAPKTVCGGSILNERWILTSADCVTLLPNFGKVQVKVGKHKNEKDGEFVQTSEVLLRLVHKNYKITNKKLRAYDIALLKLKTSLNLNDRVKPVKLPKAFKTPNGKANLTGWGSESTNVIPKLPDVLQVAEVEILSRANCEDAIRTSEPGEILSELQICSGPLDKPLSACVGDSGDPLVKINKCDKRAVQIGIASWAAYPCGQVGVPTVYTRVSAFIDWIEERVAENSENDL